MNPLPIIAGIVLVAILLSSPEKVPGIAVPANTCVPGTVHHNYFVDLPPEYRQKNYGPSCGYASTISLCRAQGLFKEAEYIRKNFGGPSGPGSINYAMGKAGLKYIYTTDGDLSVLEYGLKTNRGCGVGWYSRHATNLVGICDKNGKPLDWDRRNQGYAVILDNNHVNRYTRVRWTQWVNEWRGLGGWGWVIVSERTKPFPEVPKS